MGHADFSKPNHPDQPTADAFSQAKVVFVAIRNPGQLKG
jgi:hypothetical protein